MKRLESTNTLNDSLASLPELKVVKKRVKTPKRASIIPKQNS